MIRIAAAWRVKTLPIAPALHNVFMSVGTSFGPANSNLRVPPTTASVTVFDGTTGPHTPQLVRSLVLKPFTVPVEVWGSGACVWSGSIHSRGLSLNAQQYAVTTFPWHATLPSGHPSPTAYDVIVGHQVFIATGSTVSGPTFSGTADGVPFDVTRTVGVNTMGYFIPPRSA